MLQYKRCLRCKDIFHELKKEDKFCEQCGAVKESYRNGDESFKNNINTSKYSMYEEFHSVKESKKWYYTHFDECINKELIEDFVITDKSVIYDNKEFLLEDIGPITYRFYISSLRKLYRCDRYMAEISIEGEKRFLYCGGQSMKFANAAIRANERINSKSEIDTIKYIHMMTYYLKTVNSSILHNLPEFIFTWKDPKYYECNEFSELPGVLDRKINILNEILIDKETRLCLQDYKYIQQLLNNTYKKINAIPKEFRSDSNLLRIIKHMEESNDLVSAIYKVHEEDEISRKRFEEERQRVEEQLRKESESYEESSGGGFLSFLIRQKIESANISRHRGNRGKRDLIGEAGCAKNYGERCSSCNLRFGCSRYFF